MARRWLIVLFYCVCSGLAALTAGQLPAAPANDSPAAETVVRVIGTARVQGDDVDAARNRAISNSLVTAIDQASGDWMPLAFRVDRFQALNDILYSKAGRFVHGYRVLTETMSGKYYRVLVEASLSTAMLRQYLADANMLPEKTTIPRVLFLIAEQNLDDSAPNYWWGKGIVFLEGASEARMMALMAQQELKIIDHGPAMLHEIVQDPAAAVRNLGPTPDDAQALMLGNRFGADVVLVGVARAQRAGNVMGEIHKTFKGSLAARALRTDTGEKIAEVFRTSVAMDTDDISGGRQALVEVGALAAEAMGPQILAAWRAHADTSMTATVVVEGSRQLAYFVKFRNLLQDLPMVSDVETSTIKPNEATLRVRFKGNTRELADTIMLNAFDSFSINISDMTPDYISLSLVPK